MLKQVLIDRLANWGFECRFFIIFRERLSYVGPRAFGPEFDDYETVMLGPEDMGQFDRVDGRNQTSDVLVQRLKEGKQCMALRQGDTIVSFTWFDPNATDYTPCRYPNTDNGVYLFDAHTLKAFRGRGLAPYMRYQCYEVLKRMGRENFYSATEYTNRAAYRFKEKLNAEKVLLYLRFRLFGWFDRTWILKRYPI